ncbi:MAG: hypothetical protein KBG35_07625 [Thauera sp.]|jgi:hypothetical protein|nr:hypothetical protein [Thauera sp.]
MNTLQPGDGGLFAEVRQLNTSNGRGRGKQHCLRGAATFPGEANVHTLCAEASTSSVRRPRGNPGIGGPERAEPLAWHASLAAQRFIAFYLRSDKLSIQR